jgi:hypothetical protein
MVCKIGLYKPCFSTLQKNKKKTQPAQKSKEIKKRERHSNSATEII